MSSSDYLRNRLASLQKVVSVRKPTDSSVYTARKRMATTALGFFIDGTSVGSTRINTDGRPTHGTILHGVDSYSKASTGKVPLSSDRTTYAASQAAAYDFRAQDAGGKRELACVPMPPTTWAYTTSSDVTRALKSTCLTKTGGVTDAPGAPLFEDDTIRVSSGVPSKVDGCCGHKIEKANHTPKSGLPFNRDIQAYGKPFYVPPNPVPANVAPKQGGGHLGPRTSFVERKHGFVAPTKPIPVAPGGQGQDKATLRINDPTFFSKL